MFLLIGFLGQAKRVWQCDLLQHLSQVVWKRPRSEKPKVRDYDNVTRCFITAAHQQCNLQLFVNYQLFRVYFSQFSWIRLSFDSLQISIHLQPQTQSDLVKYEKVFQSAIGFKYCFTRLPTFSYFVSILSCQVTCYDRTAKPLLSLWHKAKFLFGRNRWNGSVGRAEKGFLLRLHLSELTRLRSRLAENFTIGWPVRTTFKRIMGAPS